MLIFENPLFRVIGTPSWTAKLGALSAPKGGYHFDYRERKGPAQHYQLHDERRIQFSARRTPTLQQWHLDATGAVRRPRAQLPDHGLTGSDRDAAAVRMCKFSEKR